MKTSESAIFLENLPAFFEHATDDGAAVVTQLDTLCSRKTRLADYPLAASVIKNVPVYDGDFLRGCMDEPTQERAILAEWNACLDTGPGVFAIQRAYRDKTLVDAVTHLFKAIIEEETQRGLTQNDHFGANERIWNSLQKVALKDPDLFIPYYGNSLLALASRAWLGPFYQITAQVNNVKPGSNAQTPHRDYHLGFQTEEVIAQFPARAQVISQYLTLQGAIAHTDMPLASGPTLLLPFSQQAPGGYLGIRQPACKAYFDAHHVQIPMEKGDAVFFSPALFHGAGANAAGTDRMANLVQISSVFGRPMETVNRYRMIAAVYPVLVAKKEDLPPRTVRDVVAALADGYAFPTNLDSDPPAGGNAPVTARDYLEEALAENWSPQKLQEVLDAYAGRRTA